MSRELRATTPFPNRLLDEAMPLLKDTEWRVLCVIVRQTLGWQDKQRQRRKESDWLTRAQLKARTGRNSEALALAIDALVRQGYISTVNEKGGPLLTPTDRRANQGRIYYGLSDGWCIKTEKEQKPTRLAETEPHSAMCSLFVSPARKSEHTSPRNPNTTKETQTKENATKELETQEFLTQSFLTQSLSTQASPTQSPPIQTFSVPASLTTSSSPENEEADESVLSVLYDSSTPAMCDFVAQFLQIAGEHNFREVDAGLTPRNGDRLEKLLGKNNNLDWTPHLHRFFESDLSYVRRGKYSLATFLDVCHILLVTRPGTSLKKK